MTKAETILNKLASEQRSSYINNVRAIAESFKQVKPFYETKPGDLAVNKVKSIKKVVNSSGTPRGKTRS